MSRVMSPFEICGFTMVGERKQDLYMAEWSERGKTGEPSTMSPLHPITSPLWSGSPSPSLAITLLHVVLSDYAGPRLALCCPSVRPTRTPCQVTSPLVAIERVE